MSVQHLLNFITKLALKLNLLIAFCFFLPHILCAQENTSSYKLRGRVIGLDGLAIPYATVKISSTQAGAVKQGKLTDSIGQFEFLIAQQGIYQIRISSVGSDTTTLNAIITTQPIIELGDIVLKATSKNLDEVKVIGKKAYIEQRIDMTVLNVENSVENSSLAVGNSVLDVLQRAPGVYVANDGKIDLKGKSGASVLIIFCTKLGP